MVKEIKGYYLALLESAATSTFPYSIHGLWQRPKDVKNIHFTQHMFDIDVLGPILDQLHRNWSNYTGRDRKFWKHEWTRHGMCTGMSELEYFTKALECFEQVKLKGSHWVQTHQVGHRHILIPYDMQWNISHLEF